MDYRRMAEDDERDEAMSEPHEIPDIAAEAAQSGGATIVRQPAEERSRLDPQKLGALLDEIEACYRVLAVARE
jgi:uncharacterized protein with PhoU and TrkA domain